MSQARRVRALRRLAALGFALGLLAPAATAAAAGPLILRIGTDQELEVLNPWHSVTGRGLRGVHPQLRPAGRFRQELEPVPGFAESWSSSADGMTHTFKIRPDMTWSDGDARHVRGRSLDLSARAGRGRIRDRLHRLRLPGAVPHERRPQAGHCTDPFTLVVTTEFPTTLLTQAYVPILPKHVWERYTLEQIGNAEAEGFFKNEPIVVGTGPYVAVDWEPGEFIKFKRNECYWGKRGVPDEIIYQTFERPDTMVEALKSGEVGLHPRRRCRPVRRADRRAGHRDGRGLLERLHLPLVQHQGQLRGLQRLDIRAVGRRVPRCVGLRARSRPARRRHPRRPRRPGHDAGAAVPRGLACAARDPTHLRSRRGQPAARRGRLRPRRRGQPPGQGRQADRPPPDVAGLRGGTARRTPSSSRAGSRRSGSPSTRMSRRRASCTATTS